MNLVFVHGLSGSSRWWREVLPLLPGQDVRLLDIPRFRRRFRPADAVDWLSQELDPGEPVVLVGHSMGGLVCALLAAERPDLVRALVLVDPTGAPASRTPGAYAVGLAAALAVAPVTVVRRLAGDALRTGPEALVHGALFATRTRFAGAISAPTLVVWGELDLLLPVGLSAVWQEAVPQAEVVVIGGAGHAPMIEAPSAFAEALLQFLDRLGDRPGV